MKTKFYSLLITQLLVILSVSLTTAQTPCMDWENPSPTAGWNDFNVEFGGAPSYSDGECPVYEIEFYEIWAGEAHALDNVVAGNSYTFSHCNGPGAGSWVPEYTIISPSGAVDAFGTGNLDGCSISWLASESGTYLIVINEAGACGVQNTMDNGYPAITCGYLGGFISGTVFNDLNCNGAFDIDEQPASGMSVLRNGQAGAFSNSLGEYSLLIPINEPVELTTSSIPGYTVNSHDLLLDSEQVIENIDFAMCPESDFVNLGAAISPTGLPPRPGFEHSYSLCITNTGSVASDAEVVLNFSDMPGNSLVDDGGGDLSGTELTWELDQLGVFEQVCYSVSFLVETGTEPGTVLNPTLTVQSAPDPSADLYHENDGHTYTHDVVAAFDPNDKTVNKPVVNHTEIEDGEGAELEYVIRFQNTGNFFATFVRVEDVLPELLDLNTLEMIHASHDYELIVHDGQHIEWFFDNIMLPDSTTDEPGSHGHIHFRINTVPGVQLEDVIENSASIFFDFKEPVITEPAITSFMDCSEGSLSILPPESFCVGEEFSLTSNRDDFENYNWSIGGSDFEGEEIDLTFFAAGPVLVNLTATNAVCTLNTELELQVMDPPYINMILEPWLGCFGEVEVDLEPYGEVNWYLEDDLVASGNPVTLFNSGLYEVTVENECGMIENNVDVEVYDIPDEVTLTFNGEQLVVSPEGSDYVWLLEGLPVSTEGPAFTPTESGDYTVIVYFEGSMCSQTSNMVFVPVSINELLDSQITLYPNPAKDFVTIELPQGEWQLNLMDAVGNRLQSLENITGSRFDLELKGIAPGAYFLQVSSDEESVVKKLVME